MLQHKFLANSGIISGTDAFLIQKAIQKYSETCDGRPLQRETNLQ